MGRTDVTLQDAILWGALGYLAGKKANRDLLEDGAAHDLSISINGTIDRRKVAQEVAGVLSIGHASPASRSESPDASELLAFVLSKLDAPLQARLMAQIQKAWDEGGLPAIDPGHPVRVQAWLKSLKRTIATTKRGSLVFTT